MAPGSMRWAVPLLVMLASAVAVAPVRAATTVGESFVPDNPCSAVSFTLIQTQSAANSYAAPTSGVVTAWTHVSAANPLEGIKLKIARPLGGGQYRMVGESAMQVPVANTLNTYPARIAVQAGDLLGFGIEGSGQCAGFTDPAYGYGAIAGDPPPGTDTDLPLTMGGQRLSLSAQLEPDADGDGFGDETQDECPRVASQQLGPCVPDTAITKQPKKKVKTKRKRAKAVFEFTATEPAASFECKLDDAGYKPCSSPKTYKVRQGKHAFEVRAVNSGLLDGTPAAFAWKVKRKR